MNIWGNEWKILTDQIKELSKAVDSKGAPTLTKSALNKLEKNLKKKHLQPIFQYFQIIGQIFEKITPNYYYIIPREILKESKNVRENIAQIFSNIRTIQIVYKHNRLFESWKDELKPLDLVAQSLERLLLRLWTGFPFIEIEKTEKKDAEKIDIEKEETTYNKTKNKTNNKTNYKKDENSNEDDLNKKTTIDCHIWAQIQSIKDSRFRLETENFKRIFMFDSFKNLENLMKQFQKINKTPYIIWSELENSQELSKDKIFNDPVIREELLFLSVEIGVLLPPLKEKIEKDKEKRVLIQNSLTYFLEKRFLEAFRQTNFGKRLQLPQSPENLNIQKNLANKIQDYFTKIQDSLNAKFSGDVKKISEELNFEIEKAISDIEHAAEWIDVLEPYFSPYRTPSRNLKKLLTYVKNELYRIMDDYNDFAQTILQENQRSELQNQVEQLMRKLNEIIMKYNEKMAELLNSENKNKLINEIKEKIKKEIDETQRELIKLQNKGKQIFIKFKEQQFNAVNLVQYWQKQYQIAINKVKFPIRQYLHDIADQFRPLIEFEEKIEPINMIIERNTKEKNNNNNKKQNNNQKIESIGFNKEKETWQFDSETSSITSLLELDLLAAPLLNEKEIRAQMELIDNQIEYLKNAEKTLTKAKEQYRVLLEDYLKEHLHTESKQCIICHQMVDVTQDHFIQCEFCGAISHYICIAWWIDKYNSCPVCHNQYTLPHSAIYDEEQLEH